MSGSYPEGSVHGAPLTTEYSADSENSVDALSTVKFDGLGCSVCGCALMVLRDLRVLGDRRVGVERWECPVCGSPVDEYAEVSDS